MGKKAKTKSGKDKAKTRKLDKSALPAPPAPVAEEIGSQKLLTEPKVPGSTYKALDRDGYDDGGVADLTLVIDLEDSVMRRKRGDVAYFQALKADLLPRVTTGQLANVPRREQKIRLAKILFSGEDGEDVIDEASNPSEVYTEKDEAEISDADKKKMQERLDASKFALRLATVLREPACASLCLSEISKRYLAMGKQGADAAVRCAEKAVSIAGDGFYDNDVIAIESDREPKVDTKHEENATYPGLAHATSLKLQSVRVSELCLRSAYLHLGNGLQALNRNDEARVMYAKGLPFLEKEPRCGRLDWERSSLIVNIGNTFSRDGDFKQANDKFSEAENLGLEHLKIGGGNVVDGMGIQVNAMRNRAFAMKKSGKEEDAKKKMKEVLELQSKLSVAETEQKEKEKKSLEEQQAKDQAAANPSAKPPSKTSSETAAEMAAAEASHSSEVTA